MHSLTTSRNGYRADIDGIRSLAVLSVFFFHLQPTLLPGGFLGVDVFFVISGYLITGIILRENHLGIFSFIHFYTRRVKRIFPALFVVLLLSAFVATFLLPPDSYSDFMTSARFASGQLANFFFSRDVGYFNEGFSGQPLLHTWSLGVEEQFYLFWPLLIYCCFRIFGTSQPHGAPGKPPDISAADRKTSTGDNLRTPLMAINKKIAGVMLLLSLVSFAVCSFLTENNYNLAFYMFYTRALEFCIGGFISLQIVPSPKTDGVNKLLGALGFLLLFYSFIFVKEEYFGLSFLQFGVLLPCIGTALLIHANYKKGFFNKVLATRLPVSIGKISYSLYLYHWPVIIFWKIYNNSQEITVLASLGIICVSFVFAFLSFLLVEQPARRSRLPDRRILALAGAVIIVSAVLFKNLENFETASWRITSYINEKSLPLQLYSPGCRKEEKNGLEYYRCSEDKIPTAPIVAIVGDSHSPHFLFSTTVWAEKNGYDVIFDGLPACPILIGDIRVESTFGDDHEENCRRQVSLFQTKIVDDERVEIILLAHRFDLFHTGFAYANRTRPMVSFKDSKGKRVRDHTGYYRDRLEDTVNTIRAKGKELIILKQVPIFDGAKDCDWEPRIKQLLNKERVCDYDPAFFQKWQQPSIDFIDEFAATHHVPVFDPVPFFDRPLHEGVNLYSDSDHLNEYGKQFLVPYFVKAIDDIVGSKNGGKSQPVTVRTP